MNRYGFDLDNFVSAVALCFGVGGLILTIAIVGVAGCAELQSKPFRSPVETCTAALALSPDVQLQAKKVNLSATELARQVCDAALLAAKITKANLTNEHDAGSK
jgi:hypothetical protein